MLRMRPRHGGVETIVSRKYANYVLARGRGLVPSLTVAALLLLLTAPHVRSGPPPSPPPLPSEHSAAGGAFTFRTPEDWQVGTPDPDTVEAKAAGFRVRFHYQPSEIGFDGLHVACMMDRPVKETVQFARVNFDYDFASGEIGERRVLDSAFFLSYDDPVEGHREWRQRNVTVVGKGESLCVVVHCPTKLWKRQENRLLLDAIVRSVSFR
jgi:hypothetical protein